MESAFPSHPGRPPPRILAALAEGLDFQAFKNATGVDIRDRLLLAPAKPFSGLGLVETTAQSARITEKGVAVSDHMLSRVGKHSSADAIAGRLA